MFVLYTLTCEVTCELRGQQRVAYHLVGLVVHKQIHQQCGHYITFLRSPVDDTQWICADDATVHTYIHTYIHVHTYCSVLGLGHK